MKGPLVIDLLTFYWHPGLSFFTVNTTSAYVNHKAKQQDEDSQEFSEWHRWWAGKRATVSRVRAFFFGWGRQKHHIPWRKMSSQMSHIPVALSQIRLCHRTAVSPKECSRVLLVDCNNVRGRGHGGRFVSWLLEARLLFLNSVGPHLHFWSFFSSIWWHFPEPAKCDFGRCTAWRGTYDTSAYHRPKMITIWRWWGVHLFYITFFGDIYSMRGSLVVKIVPFFAKREQWDRETHVESIADSLSLSKVHNCSEFFCPTKVTEVPHLHTIPWTQTGLKH